jgi:hypothetical protein
LACFPFFGSALQVTPHFHSLVGTGRPLHEPLVAQGPFIMNTREQLVDAVRRYQAGEMGRLAAT